MAWKKAVEVKVLVNGEVAQEYNDGDGESCGPKIITKYIEAISGAEFAVQFELKHSFWFRCALIRFDIAIDGKSLDATFARKQSFEGRPQGSLVTLNGIRRSHGITWSLEKFCFSEIKTSDDNTQTTGTDLRDRTADIGTIVVELHRMHKGVYHPPGIKSSSWGWDELTELGTLPEKALKGQALSHSASLSLPQFAEPSGIWEGCEYLDGKDNPFLVFKFKYRSRKALQDLRIIERTHPLEERPIEDLTFEEARELVRRQREHQASPVAHMKAEIKPECGVKREYEDDEEYSALLESARANKVPRIFEEGEVIDLSED